MQVVDGKDKRTRRGQLFDKLGKLAEHAIASDAKVALRQLSQNRFACQPRHLCEPGWRPTI